MPAPTASPLAAMTTGIVTVAFLAAKEQLSGQIRKSLGVAIGRAIFDNDIVSFDISEFLQAV